MKEPRYHPERLKAIRDECGLTQGEVASKGGIDQSFLSKCERGLAVPTLQMVASIAPVYNMRVAEVIDRCFGETADDDAEVA